MALHWFLLSNETRMLEGSIVLNQAALERLSQEFVQAKGDRKEGTWIKDALIKAGIPIMFPTQHQDLRKFAEAAGFEHGPHALVKIRNDLIHSNMKFGTLCGDIYSQARELGLWYAELMLLRIFGYKGKYGNRLTQESPGQVELVPWAAGS